MDVFKTLKLWQIGMLVVVLVGAAGATYGVYALVSGSGLASLGEDQQLIPVQYGDLVNQVSTNGSLIFPNREALAFASQGTVGEVLVEEGQQVEEGQELAKLDETTVASLEKAIAEARVNLQNAEDALAKAKDPHTAVDLAQAESNVANAGLSLQNAQDDLAGLLEPTAQGVAQAETNVANAKLSLQDAQDTLASVLQATDQEIAQAEATVTNDKISVQNAREALDAIKSGPTDDDVATAQSQVDSAGTALVNATRDLSLAEREWNTKVGMAQDTLDAALEDYQGVFQKWLGVDPGEVEGDINPDALLDAWGADLASLFDPNVRFQDSNLGFLAVGPPPDDPVTPWSEFIIYAWMNLSPENVVATCEDVVITRETQCVKKEMDDAWDALEPAIDNLDTVKTQAAKAIANAEEAITRAEESLANAEETLAELNADPDPLEIEAREKELALAETNLDEAEARLEELTNRSNALEVEAKEKQVALSQADLDEVQGELSRLKGGPDALELEVQRKKVAVAQANLYDAGEELAGLKGSADPLEVALREADLMQAQLALDTALQRLEVATLRAPMTGIISLMNVEVGQEVNVNTPVINIVDPTVVEVDGIVDEIDVLFIREGAQAQVTMDALPGQVLEGIVSSIGSAAQNQQGVVSYPIRIQVQVPEGVQLREGLSATANIVIRQDTDVLLVPLQAIYGTFEQPVVKVMNGGRIEERAVALGNSDDFWVVVLQGLQEGDQVAMEATEASTDPFAQIRQRIQGGGGGGGFGGGGAGGFPGGGGGRRGN